MNIYIKYLTLSLISAIVYPVVFKYVYDSQGTPFFYSLIHSSISSLIMYRVISRSLLRRNSNISMAVVFILINLLYFNASSIKYYELYLHQNFIEDNFLRFIFSIYGMLVIWLSFEWININKKEFKSVKFALQRKYLLVIIICLLLSYAMWGILQNYNKGFAYNYLLGEDPLIKALEQTELPLIDKLNAWIANIGMVVGVLVLLLTIYCNQKGGIALIVLSATIISIYSAVTGYRSILLLFVICILFSLVIFHNLGKYILSTILITGQYFIAIGSITILIVSGRFYSNETDLLKYQLAYRWDLTDYAATIVYGNDPYKFNPTIISDAIYYSLPEIIYKDKYEKNDHTVDKIINNAGLDERIDYLTTFFSIGAQLGGFVGFILMPLIMVLLLYKLELYIYKYFSYCAKFIIIILLPLCQRVETNLNSLFADLRMLPIYIIVSFILYHLFYKQKYYVTEKKQH